MTGFKDLNEFNRRFQSMGVEELRHWRAYWTEHARHLSPKVRKEAMRRVHQIDKAIHLRLPPSE